MKAGQVLAPDAFLLVLDSENETKGELPLAPSVNVLLS